jgi:hypothetical protein
MYTTTRAVKFEFDTTELTRVLVSFNGGGAVYRAPLVPLYDRQFSLILNELEPGQDYEIGLSLVDPAGNERFVTFPARTADRVRPEPLHVERVRLRTIRDMRGRRPVIALADVALRVGKGYPQTGYVVHAALYHDSITNGPSLVASISETLTRQDGSLEIAVDIPPSIPTRDGEFVFAILSIDAPQGAPPHVRGEDLEQRASATY